MSTSPTPPPLEYATPVAAPPRKFLRRFAWVLAIGLVIVFFMLMRQPRSSTGNTPTVTLGQFTLAVNAGDLFSADVGDSDVEFSLNSKRNSGNLLLNSASGRYRVDLPSGTGNDWKFLQWLTDAHNGGYASVTLSHGQNLVENLLLPLVPWLLIFGFIWFTMYRYLKNSRKRPTPVVVMNPEAFR